MVDHSDRRRSGLRAGRVGKHPGRIRQVTSTDSVLVRWRLARSPARTRHEAHSSRTRLAFCLSDVASARCGGAADEQLDTVGEGRRGSSKSIRRRRRAGTWLVHRTRSPGAVSRSRTASAAAASRTCSQLSRITTAEASLNDSTAPLLPPGPSTALTNTSMTWSGVLRALRPADAVGPTPADVELALATDRAIATAGLPDPPSPRESPPTARRRGGRTRRQPRLGGRATLCGEGPTGPPWRAAGCRRAQHPGAGLHLEAAVAGQDPARLAS